MALVAEADPWPGLERARRVAPTNIDVLIIGAGTAGCVLANRLSTDPSRVVVMIEAGGQDTTPDIAARIEAPHAWPTLLGSTADWRYATCPQAHLDGRVLAYPRGKVLGGSSSINAMGHQRGDPSIYDAWARAGLAGWAFQDLLPYFKRSENFDRGADDLRGGSGPIKVIRPAADLCSPLATAFLEAAQGEGHPFIDDFNGAGMVGSAWNQLAIDGVVRASASQAYLRPVRWRENLTVLTGHEALSLNFDGLRCTGAHVVDDAGATLTLNAAETILAAGAIDTPRLLMLSGVGDPDALRRLNIPVRAPAREVGRNLADHPLCGVVFEATAPLAPSHYNHGEALAFARSESSSGSSDVQIIAVDVPFVTAEMGPAPAAAFSLLACLMLPQSRGTVTLALSRPRAPAIINPNYLAESVDASRLLDAVEMARTIGAQAALKPFVKGEFLPGSRVHARGDRLNFVRKALTPFFHPVGTCRMGLDQASVTDLAMKVRGVEALRIVDASVLPGLPNAMPNAAILAFAERASDLIAQGG